MENTLETILKVNNINLTIEGWSISEDLNSQYNMLNINGNITSEYIALSNSIKTNYKSEKINIESQKLILTFENTSFNSFNINSSYDEGIAGNFSINIHYSKLEIVLKK